MTGRASRRQRSVRLAGRGVGSTIRLLVVLLVVAVSLGPGMMRAQAPVDYAGIVIRPGDGTVTYAYVPLDTSVSGIELLRKSGISLVTVGFGGLGEGVCRIEQTGCDVGPCRTRLCQTGDRESPYWRYFQQDDTGQWVGSPLGGSATTIAPGEIDGWSWTPDDARLPEVTLAAIPGLAQATGNLDQAHFARYDENGVLMARNGAFVIPWRQYAAVGLVLALVAGFALLLRLRPRNAA